MISLITINVNVPENFDIGPNLINLGEKLMSVVSDALGPVSSKLDTVLTEIQALQAKIAAGGALSADDLALIQAIQNKVDGLVTAGQEVVAAARAVTRR